LRPGGTRGRDYARGSHEKGKLRGRKAERSSNFQGRGDWSNRRQPLKKRGEGGLGASEIVHHICIKGALFRAERKLIRSRKSRKGRGIIHRGMEDREKRGKEEPPTFNSCP